MNVNNDEWDLVTGFFEYGYSAEGMEHVSEVGYVALPASMISDIRAELAEQISSRLATPQMNLKEEL